MPMTDWMLRAARPFHIRLECLDQRGLQSDAKVNVKKARDYSNVAVTHPSLDTKGYQASAI